MYNNNISFAVASSTIMSSQFNNGIPLTDNNNLNFTRLCYVEFETKEAATSAVEEVQSKLVFDGVQMFAFTVNYAPRDKKTRAEFESEPGRLRWYFVMSQLLCKLKISHSSNRVKKCNEIGVLICISHSDELANLQHHDPFTIFQLITVFTQE